MISNSRVVLQKDRSAIIYRHQHVHRSVIVKIADGHSACGKTFLKRRTSHVTDILQSPAIVVIKQQRLQVADVI